MSLIFAPELRVELFSHIGLEEKKRPTYIFNQASITESSREDGEYEKIPDMDYESVLDMCVESIHARLVRVEVNNKNRKGYSNLRDTLTHAQVIELFALMRLTGRLTYEDKKKSKSQSSIDMESSAPVATEKSVE